MPSLILILGESERTEAGESKQAEVADTLVSHFSFEIDGEAIRPLQPAPLRLLQYVDVTLELDRRQTRAEQSDELPAHLLISHSDIALAIYFAVAFGELGCREDFPSDLICVQTVNITFSCHSSIIESADSGGRRGFGVRLLSTEGEVDQY